MVLGDLLITLLNNSDRVKIACLAQLVNVIAPIMTETGGRVWAQTIFYPFMYTSHYGRGTALKNFCCCDSYDTCSKKNVPLIDSAAVISDDENEITIFAVNRSLESECELDINLAGFEKYKPYTHVSLEGSDLKAVNTADSPENVIPTVKNISNKIILAPHSWNMIVLKRGF